MARHLDHDVAEVLFICATNDLGLQSFDLTKSLQPVWGVGVLRLRLLPLKNQGGKLSTNQNSSHNLWGLLHLLVKFKSINSFSSKQICLKSESLFSLWYDVAMYISGIMEGISLLICKVILFNLCKISLLIWKWNRNATHWQYSCTIKANMRLTKLSCEERQKKLSKKATYITVDCDLSD